MEHKLQRDIILKLIHQPEMSFNELWAKDGESNAFTYHLNKLVEQGLINKQEAKYTLTQEGKKLSAFIEGDSGKRAKFPTFAHCIVVWGREGEILCQKRLKEPFYGALGFVSGKINFGQNLVECAKRDLLEETGLTAEDIKVTGLEQTKTYENGELLHHHYLFVIHARTLSGELVIKTHKAEHTWKTPEAYHESRSFPETFHYQELFFPTSFAMVESERFMENGKFINGKLIKMDILCPPSLVSSTQVRLAQYWNSYTFQSKTFVT